MIHISLKEVLHRPSGQDMFWSTPGLSTCAYSPVNFCIQKLSDLYSDLGWFQIRTTEKLWSNICPMCKSIMTAVIRLLYHYRTTCLACTVACIRIVWSWKAQLVAIFLQMSSENVLEMVRLYSHCSCKYLTLLLVKWAVCICKFCIFGGSFVFIPTCLPPLYCDSSETPGTWRSTSSPEGRRTCQRTAWREQRSSVRTKD